MNPPIESIHNSGYQACLVVAGGGSGAVHALLSRPGASRFVLDVRIPYSREAMIEFLGENPVVFCAEQTVRKMSAAALKHASRYSKHGALGIACTAALRSTVERTEPDEAFIGFQTLENEVFHRLEFPAGTREQQEEQLSAFLLEKLADFVAQ
ncbi:CinA family protein [Pontiellaceae bacterium B12219]|nr:CinA family protein [Pontiellaceae bacterium B12219]